MKLIATLVAGLALVNITAGAQGMTKQAKIEKILELSHVNNMLNQMFDQIKAMTTAQMPHNLTGEQQAKAEETQTKILDLIKSRLSWEKMRPGYIKLYDETFTADEIDGLYNFYQTPAGRAMLEKMPTLLTKSMALGQAAMADIQPELQRIVKESQEKK